jgi:hypothetical protein
MSAVCTANTVQKQIAKRVAQEMAEFGASGGNHEAGWSDASCGKLSRNAPQRFHCRRDAGDTAAPVDSRIIRGCWG